MITKVLRRREATSNKQLHTVTIVNTCIASCAAAAVATPGYGAVPMPGTAARTNLEPEPMPCTSTLACLP